MHYNELLSPLIMSLKSVKKELDALKNN